MRRDVAPCMVSEISAFSCGTMLMDLVALPTFQEMYPSAKRVTSATMGNVQSRMRRNTPRRRGGRRSCAEMMCVGPEKRPSSGGMNVKRLGEGLAGLMGVVDPSALRGRFFLRRLSMGIYGYERCLAKR